MSKLINIQGKLIDFPTSAQSPNWAQPVVEFAEAVGDALAGIAGTYDVPPQVYSLISDVNTLVDVPLLTFPTSAVRSAFIRYALYRTSDTTTESETGTLEIVYNSSAGQWLVVREAVGTDTKLTFEVTNTGQVQFSTSAIGGTYQSGVLSYVAQAILQNS